MLPSCACWNAAGKPAAASRHKRAPESPAQEGHGTLESPSKEGYGAGVSHQRH